MLVCIDDLSNAVTRALLALHIKDLQKRTPPESCRVIDLRGLEAPEITVFTAWENDDLLGCGALKEVTSLTGEIKSMRTAERHLRRGVGQAIARHIINIARERGYTSLYVETGTDQSFASARALYGGLGFTPCEAFDESFVPSEQNCFMILPLG